MWVLYYVPAFSLNLFSVGGAGCHVVKTLKQPNEDMHVENLRPSANSCVSEPSWKWIFQPHEDFRQDWKPYRHPDVRDSEPQPPNQIASEFLTLMILVLSP